MDTFANENGKNNNWNKNRTKTKSPRKQQTSVINIGNGNKLGTNSSIGGTNNKHTNAHNRRNYNNRSNNNNRNSNNRHSDVANMNYPLKNSESNWNLGTKSGCNTSNGNSVRLTSVGTKSSSDYCGNVGTSFFSPFPKFGICFFSLFFFCCGLQS